MDVTLINASDELLRLDVIGNRIVEYYRDMKNKYLLHIQLFDPDSNTVEEITPERTKIDFIKVINAIWECRDIYYTSFQTLENNQIELSVFKYKPDSGEEQKIVSLVRDMDVISGNTRVKVFILSASTVLIQSEQRILVSSEKLMGNIKFDLTLLNVETQEETAVTDNNFINNGINMIIPLSDKKVMVKTGYSYLEDARLGTKEGHESLIESVYVATVAKFIADLTISADSVDMPLIESAYLDKHILLPAATEGYIHYSVVDSVNGTSKCVFYKHDTEERLEYTVNGFYEDDLYITYVINQMPYVRRNTESEIHFFNLKKAETDIIFYDELFIDQKGKIFLLSPKKDTSYLHIYAYPELNNVLHEKTVYMNCCCLEGNYYVYVI